MPAGQGAQSGWTVVGDSGANAAQTLSKAAGGAGTRHYVTGFEVTITAAASTAVLAIDLQEAPSTNKWRTGLPTGQAIGAGIYRDFSNAPIELAENVAAELEVPAAGAAVVTRACLKGYTI